MPLYHDPRTAVAAFYTADVRTRIGNAVRKLSFLGAVRAVDRPDLRRGVVGQNVWCAPLLAVGGA